MWTIEALWLQYYARMTNTDIQEFDSALTYYENKEPLISTIEYLRRRGYV